MRIAAHQAGGAGSYLGGRLARARAGVRFIARGMHPQALTKRGLRVHNVTGDFQGQQLQPWDRAADIVTILLPPSMLWHNIEATHQAAV